jgi:hypothetical protein
MKETSMSNTALWDSVCKTDPKHTKDFQKGGGFKGTAINALYLIHKATELWGPMGGKWGVEIVREGILDGAPLLGGDERLIGNEKVHYVQINLIHPTGALPAFGQTTFVGRNKNGYFTDEEAPKKSLTDAVTKALSWLGFSADVHLGMYDDNKYVAQLEREFSQPALMNPEQVKAITDKANEVQVPVANILERYKVESLDRIPAEKYQIIINNLNKAKKAA